MFIAHLPAAILLAQVRPAVLLKRPWLLVGAVLPDADLAVFYLWHAGSTHHHSYLTHRPALWMGLLLVALVIKRLQFGGTLKAICIGALLHLVLDSVAGKIAWGWPLSNVAVPLVVVPATYDWWVLSFLTHWTFGVELLICTMAALVLWQRLE